MATTLLACCCGLLRAYACDGDTPLDLWTNDLVSGVKFWTGSECAYWAAKDAAEPTIIVSASAYETYSTCLECEEDDTHEPPPPPPCPINNDDPGWGDSYHVDFNWPLSYPSYLPAFVNIPPTGDGGWFFQWNPANDIDTVIITCEDDFFYLSLHDSSAGCTVTWRLPRVAGDPAIPPGDGTWPFLNAIGGCGTGGPIADVERTVTP